MLLMSLGVLLSAQAAVPTDTAPGLVPPVQCGMPAFVGLERPELVDAHLLDVARPPSSDKLLRDAYGVTANELLTDNFVFRWGNSGGVTTAEVERLAAAFEETWLIEIDTQGHPLPTGADTWRFNVYIGSSGGGTPTDGGAAGYFWYDSNGWPMIVVGAGTLDNGDYADITAAHEFYHAIQGGTDRYPYEGDSAWFWEASATWASATVYPDNLNYASFLFGYAFLPHYPANYFNYADSWNVEDYYQYGAFILPLHLTELTADRSLVREVWTDDGPESDPLSMLQRLMDDRGLDFDEAFLDHAARMATLDYEHENAYQAVLDGYARHFSESDNVVADEVDGSTGGLIDGPSALSPYRYGYNAIRIDPGDAERLTIEVVGESTGSRGNVAYWGGRVVVEDGRDRTYAPVDFDGTDGTATVSGLNGETVWLVVSPWSRETRDFDRETFSYQYSVTADGEEPVDPGDTGEPEDTGDTDVPDDSGTPGSEDSGPLEVGTAQPATFDKEGGCSSVGLLGGGLWTVGLLAVARRREG